ncbi:hypothetical protein OE88DRAFT_728045 [Heliocybe sulcata]|uniref:Guanine nucleotide exchange factor n=1 Tax=Heliocybe sulcata TaxID=5364 RepID=A0A5C3NG12_9AGAM|nr:hypothetical protein OE88DRAFT_728045 [Heliocybe sulcata]
MSGLLIDYKFLSQSSTRADVSNVLQSIINAPPAAIDDSTRRELVQELLDDLRALAASEKNSRLSSKDVAQALLAIKTLGRHSASSEVISSEDNLKTLLAVFNAFSDDQDTSNEALRCVANALLLIEQGRFNWVEIGGGRACVIRLEKSTNPDRIFLLSRILFLSTVSMASASFILSLVEDVPAGQTGNIVDIIGTKLDLLTSSILAGAKMSREAMTDLLKLTFNLLAHYPKLAEPTDSKEASSSKSDDRIVIGDRWSERLDGILPPLLRAFNTLPPTFPSPIAAPLSHVIHSLITIPVAPLRAQWLGSLSPSSSKASSTSSARADSPSSKPPGAFDRAMSALSAGRRSLSSRPSSPRTSPPPVHDSLLRAYDLLEVSFSHYLPGDVDPDDASVRERCKKEGDHSLDDIMAPLVALVTRFCVDDEQSKVRMRNWVLPADLDRTSPLERRADMLGRCLRLLSCVYHPRLKDAVGEMLYAMCDSDAGVLSSQVGYGNVAGFLYNKGIMSAPPRPASSTAPTTASSGDPINPITGTVHQEQPEPEMTEEEKQQEMEKLMVLFERLEKTGTVKIQKRDPSAPSGSS